MKRTYSIAMPVSKDTLGRWLEANRVTFKVSCVNGKFAIDATRRELHSYSDDSGSHIEQWEVTRYGEDFYATLRAVLKLFGYDGPLPRR